VPLKAAPLEDPNFVWPTFEEIKQLHDVAVQERSQLILTQRGDDVWITESGVVWVPQDATQMQVRLCVVAHFGIAGHSWGRDYLAAIEAPFLVARHARPFLFLNRCIFIMSSAEFDICVYYYRS
jgi:hypothetical protein